MVGMELTPLGSVTLWIWIVGPLRPSDGIAYTFHDGHNLHGLDIEVILRDPSVVSQSCRVLT